MDGQETTSEAHHPATVEDEFRQIYFDALDHITNAIEERFDQLSFKAYANLEVILRSSSKFLSKCLKIFLNVLIMLLKCLNNKTKMKSCWFQR